MAKKRILTPKDEREAMNAPVNMDGKGEDPAVRAMLSDEFVGGSNLTAAEIGMAIQQILRGQNSLLENQSRFSDEIDRIRKRMDEMDKAAQRWETDRENFVNEVLEKAESLKATGDAKDKILAQGALQFQNAVAQARSEQAVEHVRFEQDLAAMPRVTIVSPGELVMVMEGGRQVAKMMQETVKIKHKKWILPIGRAVEVPLVVAQVLENRRRTQEENSARERLLSANLESGQLDAKWKEVNKTYNSTTDNIPTA